MAWTKAMLTTAAFEPDSWWRRLANPQPGLGHVHPEVALEIGQLGVDDQTASSDPATVDQPGYWTTHPVEDAGPRPFVGDVERFDVVSRGGVESHGFVASSFEGLTGGEFDAGPPTGDNHPGLHRSTPLGPTMATRQVPR